MATLLFHLKVLTYDKSARPSWPKRHRKSKRKTLISKVTMYTRHISQQWVLKGAFQIEMHHMWHQVALSKRGPPMLDQVWMSRWLKFLATIKSQRRFSVFSISCCTSVVALSGGFVEFDLQDERCHRSRAARCEVKLNLIWRTRPRFGFLLRCSELQCNPVGDHF